MITTSSQANRITTVSYSQRLRPYFLTLARRIQQWSDGNEAACGFGITSCNRREGKSTVATNLAAALSSLQSEKVLLIEADFGNPTLSKRNPYRNPGLTELITGDASVADCIIPTSLERLYLLGCGRLNATEIHEKPIETIVGLNRELRADYRFLIYDLPVVDEFNLALLLGQQLSGLLLVVDSNRIEPKSIDRFRKSATEYNAEVLGIVLNKAVPNRRT